jgi:hypothetical protein
MPGNKRFDNFFSRAAEEVRKRSVRRKFHGIFGQEFWTRVEKVRETPEAPCATVHWYELRATTSNSAPAGNQAIREHREVEVALPRLLPLSILTDPHCLADRSLRRRNG